MTEIEAYISRNEEPTELDFKKYFEIKYRGAYYNSMRVKATKILRQKYGVVKVGELLNMNHTTVSYLTNNRYKNPEVDELIENNFNEWILSETYPKSIAVTLWNPEQKEWSYKKDYELVNKSELINYICKK